MASPNPNYNDVLTTSLVARSKELADNATDNNAVLKWIKENGKERMFSGGERIIEELMYGENNNFSFYSGSDVLDVSATQQFTAAEYTIKQAAVPVLITGIEQIQNSGEQRQIELISSRIKGAEATMANRLSLSIYSDGTGYGGKEITGLGAAVVLDPTTGTYGGIDASANTFWRNQTTGTLGVQTTATIRGSMTDLWVNCVRGPDAPDLIVFDNKLWALYHNSLGDLVRLTPTVKAKYGFKVLEFMTADVVMDGGIGGNQAAYTGHFLNTKFLHWRPFEGRNMVPLDPRERAAFNQDATAQIIVFAGNITCSGRLFQGHFKASAA